MIAVAICAVDPALRHRLEQTLRVRPEVSVVRAVADGPSLAAALVSQDVDAVLLEWPASPGALDVLHGRRAALVVLIASEDDDEALDALHAGAHAVLPRDTAAAEIVAALAAVTTGLSVLPRATVDRLLDRSPALVDVAGRPKLTPREIEVLTAMADGASNKIIARRLGISFHTVKFHVAAILTKLEAETRTEAVANAARLGLVML